MQVILQEKIRNLGGIGDIVDVKAGYARNFLLRQGKAKIATKANVAVVEQMRADLEKKEAERMKLAEGRVQTLEQLEQLSLRVHTNEEGKLFGSVGAAEIVALFAEHGHTVHKSEVMIVEAPIRFVGVYTLHVECYAGINAVLKLDINSDVVLERLKQQEQSDAAEDVVEDDHGEQMDSADIASGEDADSSSA